MRGGAPIRDQDVWGWLGKGYVRGTRFKLPHSQRLCPRIGALEAKSRSLDARGNDGRRVARYVGAGARSTMAYWGFRMEGLSEGLPNVESPQS